jgi:aminoglycoside 6-adenylyltransferase
VHPSYVTSVEQVVAWCQQEPHVSAALVLGSQVRAVEPGDQWSDLDLLLLAEAPAALLQRRDWLAAFGPLVCVTVEETPLAWLNMTWSVVRALYADHRVLDFSILPTDRRNDVLALNAEIHVLGYEVVYEAEPDGLAPQVAASLASQPLPAPTLPTAQALHGAVDDLLFALVLALRKLKRGELWVAVTTLNGRVATRLLELIEFYTATRERAPLPLRYEGRLLERRAPADVLAQLAGCLAHYDAADVERAAGQVLALAARLSDALCAEHGWPSGAQQFAAVRRLCAEMLGSA